MQECSCEAVTLRVFPSSIPFPPWVFREPGDSILDLIRDSRVVSKRSVFALRASVARDAILLVWTRPGIEVTWRGIYGQANGRRGFSCLAPTHEIVLARSLRQTCQIVIQLCSRTLSIICKRRGACCIPPWSSHVVGL